MTDNKERVKSAVDLVSYIQTNGIVLKKESRLFVGLCPFHAEKSGSFTVYPDTQSFHCFGCHIDGDVYTFAMKRHNWTFPEALDELARYANITLEISPEYKAKQDRRERLYALMAEAAEYYDALLYTGGPSLDYLQKDRGLSAETIKAAKIGFAPGNMTLYKQMTQLGYTFQDLLDTGLIKQGDNRPYDTFSNRIVIPIRDHKGRIVAFSGRAMSKDHGPKYLHNATNEIFEKSKIVHRMPLNQSTIGFKAFDTIVMVEGSLDPVSAFNRGFYNIASTLGTALTDDHLKQICKGDVKRIVFCLDRDEAGRTALRTLTQKHVGNLASQGIELYAMFAPHGKDPDDTFREKPELWQPAVDAARPVVSVLIDLEMAKYGDRPTAVDISTLVNDLLPILKSTNPFVEDENIRVLSSKTGVAIERLKAWLSPQMHVMDKPSPAPKQEDTPLPTTAEWVLHGILRNEADGWLARANACLFIASDSPMPYALAPLNEQDFTDAQLRRFFAASVKAQAAEEMIKGNIDASLERVYERIKGLQTIGDAFGLSFDYEAFIGHVYELRLSRLQKEHPTFEGAKARECAMAIALLQLCQEEMI
jgi:DNA primase